MGGSCIVNPSLQSWVYNRSTGPSFHALWACAPLYISLQVNIVPNVLPRSFCGWLANLCTCWRKDIITRLWASHICDKWSAKSLGLFFDPSCTSSFLSLVQKSLSTTDLRSPNTNLMCSDSHFGASALSAPMILLFCSFVSASFTSRNPSSLSVARLKNI